MVTPTGTVGPGAAAGGTVHSAGGSGFLATTPSRATGVAAGRLGGSPGTRSSFAGPVGCMSFFSGGGGGATTAGAEAGAGAVAAAGGLSTTTNSPAPSPVPPWPPDLPLLIQSSPMTPPIKQTPRARDPPASAAMTPPES